MDHQLDIADRRMRSAGRNTHSARGLTSDVTWRAAAHIPLLGRTFAEAAEVARGADVLARTVLPPAFTAARTLDPKKLRAPDGTIDVGLLRRAQPSIDVAAAKSAAAFEGLRAPRKGVLPPIRNASLDFRSQARDLADALRGVQRGMRMAPALLGVDRARRYFVLIQQNSEARGTGGLAGGFAILTADKGRLRVTNQGSNADLKDGDVVPPRGVPADYVQRYRGDGAFDRWVNVNLSPDLPVVARVIAARWRKQSGEAVDGVITVDSQALRDVLRGSPPIPVTGKAPLTPKNIVDYLAVGQYRDFAAPDGSSAGIDRSAARKRLLETIAKAATSRLVNGGGSTLELMRGLADAVNSGHLRMTSDDPAIAPMLSEAGIDGALPKGPAPVAYAVVFNSSGGKLEYFLDRSITYDAGDCSSPTRKSTITVDLTNRAPAGLPPYLYNPYKLPGITPTGDRVTLTVYATRGAKLSKATLDGQPVTSDDNAVPFLNAFTEAGLPAWSTRVDLPSGKTRRMVLSLVEPSARGASRVPEQPLPRPLRRSVDVPTC